MAARLCCPAPRVCAPVMRRALLLLPLGATGGAAAACSTEEGTDYNGNDLKKVQATSAADCCAACQGTPECSFWTLINSSGHCWLKTSDSGRRPVAGRVSGAAPAPVPPPPPASYPSTYPYPGLTGTSSDDGLPVYTGGNLAEACPADLKRSCGDCKGDDPKGDQRCCQGEYYCYPPNATLRWPGATHAGSGVRGDMTRRQILEKALGWVALGYEYHWQGDGTDKQPKNQYIEHCAANDPNPDCPSKTFYGDCCGLTEMAWGAGTGCLRSSKTSVRVDCMDVQPGDAVSYGDDSKNSAKGFPKGSHIFLFRRWVDKDAGTWEIYQMGGGYGKANERPNNSYNAKKMYCMTRVDLINEQ